MKCREMLSNYKIYILGFIGAIFIISGATIVLFWPGVFDGIFYKELELRPGSKSHQQWKQTDLPLYLDIYLFNWTNPDDFEDPDIKPHFVELGPYRFREFQQKSNITWNKNETVSYRKKSTYYFDKAGSKASLDDVVTSVNIIALSAANRARTWNYVMQKSVSLGLAMYHQNIFVSKSANEWLFEGYADNMITLAKEMPILDAGDIPYDKFGWFYMKNGTTDMLGAFNANTGVNNISKIGQINNWNYHPRTEFFEGKCGELFGSAGDFFPPNIQKDNSVFLFSPEMCRSLEMQFDEDLTIKGVKVMKFSGGPKTVDNGTLYPENQCYCNGDCVPSGLLNVSSCRFGTPVFMSFPHFFNADPFYLNQVDGMKPLKEKHEFFMAFEPKTGIPLEVAARFQINALIRPIENIGLYQTVPEKFMPILWFEQHVQMTDSIADEIKLVLMVPFAGQIIGFCSVIIGIIISTFLPLKNFLKKNFCSKNQNKLDKDNGEDESMKLRHSSSKKLPEIKSLLDKKLLWNGNQKHSAVEKL